MKPLAPLLLLLLLACTDQSGDYPSLLPTDVILAEPTLPDYIESIPEPEKAVEQELDTRASDLRRTADTLRKPVIEDSFRDQMQRALQRSAN